jgi:hypothetical protein
VPKNFAAGHRRRGGTVLGFPEVAMHKYAIQLTVADERGRGAVRLDAQGGVLLGKGVDEHEQMVFGEATSRCRSWRLRVAQEGAKSRKGRRFAALLDAARWLALTGRREAVTSPRCCDALPSDTVLPEMSRRSLPHGPAPGLWPAPGLFLGL